MWSWSMPARPNCPKARIIVSHMDTVAHASLTRQSMDQALRRRGIREAILMPDDGQSYSF